MNAVVLLAFPMDACSNKRILKASECITKGPMCVPMACLQGEKEKQPVSIQTESYCIVALNGALDWG